MSTLPITFPTLPSLPTALQILAAPPSQKPGDRPISFTFDNLATGAAPVIVPLTIRPEELTRTEVSRLTVQQTLGGAWADDFGAGLTTINISGHTGWRGFQGVDGMALFQNLRATVFTNWQLARNNARATGVDPNLIQLIFADALDTTIDVVAPINFTLRRSKSRPLLCQFQISMIGLGDTPTPAQPSFLSSLVQSLGLSTIVAAVSQVVSAINSAVNFVEANIIGPIVAFMNTAVSVFNEAVAIIETPAAVVSLITGIASSLAQCGMNMFNTLGAVMTNPANVTGSLMQVSAAFSDIFCVMENAIAQQQTYPIYTALYGASNCSSTVPGSSPQSQYTLNGTNPFYDVIGTNSPPPITVSPAAQQAIDTILFTDPVLSPLTPAQLASLATTITNGVAVS